MKKKRIPDLWNERQNRARARTRPSAKRSRKGPAAKRFSIRPATHSVPRSAHSVIGLAPAKTA